MTPATVPSSSQPAEADDEDRLVRSGMQEDVEYKTYKTDSDSFEVKDVDLEGRTFEGESAAIGNRDRGNDIIMPGAFKKTIQERVEDRKVKLLNHHKRGSIEDLFGVVVEAEQREVAGSRSIGGDTPTHVLWSQFKVSRKQGAQDALADIKDGILDGMSIGFKPVRVEFVKDDDADESVDAEMAFLRGQGTRKIHELAWWESSLVIWGMNQEARPVPGSVKSLVQNIEALSEEDGPVTEKDLRYAIRHLKGVLGEQDTGACLNAEPVKHASDKLSDLIERAEDEGLVSTDPRQQVALLFEQFKERQDDAEVSHEVFIDFVSDAVKDINSDDDASEDHSDENEIMDITDEQSDALKEAIDENDLDAVKSILSDLEEDDEDCGCDEENKDTEEDTEEKESSEESEEEDAEEKDESEDAEEKDESEDAEEKDESEEADEQGAQEDTAEMKEIRRELVRLQTLNPELD